MRTLISAILFIMLSADVVAAQTIASKELRGDGSWKIDGYAKRSTQQWSLALYRGDNSAVTGLITVTDSPLFAAGRVNGMLEGNVITGTITDEQGEHVARFNGCRATAFAAGTPTAPANRANGNGKESCPNE